MDGWDRIVLLFNKKRGNFPSDIAFDLQGHRIADFLIKDEDDKSGIGDLKDIKSTIAKNPSGPHEVHFSPEQKKIETIQHESSHYLRYKRTRSGINIIKFNYLNRRNAGNQRTN